MGDLIRTPDLMEVVMVPQLPPVLAEEPTLEEAMRAEGEGAAH